VILLFSASWVSRNVSVNHQHLESFFKVVLIIQKFKVQLYLLLSVNHAVWFILNCFCTSSIWFLIIAFVSQLLSLNFVLEYGSVINKAWQFLFLFLWFVSCIRAMASQPRTHCPLLRQVRSDYSVHCNVNYELVQVS
jgi:hypothetical protein